MARLPQHSVGPGTGSQGLDAGQHAPVIGSSPSRGDKLELEGAHADSGAKRASWRDTVSHDLPIDVASEATLEVSSVGAISRVTLFESEAGANELDPRAVLALLYGPNLSRGLLSFVVPRLRHPDVLRADKHGALLERLTRTLEATPDDNTARECLVILQQELQRLLMLRQNQNSLIKG
ncbi:MULTISPECIES: hypothetical protein [Bradyrhizobium]|uniref:hypothetical protein n=1 Tax=Bradyrhizobium TaxID=374 RepID=UPI00155F1E54|nr:MULTISPECIES: hypothetical protein [Bradyrhizobium]MDD1521627.1 hypothetical protein [Bradyrhizobium sp. WBAH30]MDD1546034.1 hypothetical protein [Bradyrhizobium sp. WBAH41]MDD1559236.1 hypothetical protein [Bradyrhizobium sp. WBAH23]MDD1566752.1 hypothetical protein [Bradyrhizobium sp. WBAH33]MDD1592627.1 hypothetical protein [Bradyrhizobium sp. WBAH42]